MNKNAKPLFDAFEEANPIVVFHHISPDPDALGTQFGMVEYLRDRYPEKTILAAGTQDDMDEVDDEQIRNGLALLVDTSTPERVDDMRYKEAKKIARIDHHIPVCDFGELDYVDVDAAAAAQVAALLLKDQGETISPESAQHFMKALISDTQRFSLPTVSKKTFEAAAWLVSQGASVARAVEELYTKSLEKVDYNARVVINARRRNNLLFSVMSRDDYMACGLPFEDAKNSVNAMSNIKGMEIWALFTQYEDGTKWQGSIRSKRIPIEPLIAQFGGGGHACACGCKNLDPADVQLLIERLSELSVTMDNPTDGINECVI